MTTRTDSSLSFRLLRLTFVLCLPALMLLSQTGLLPASPSHSVEAQSNCSSTSVPATANPYLAGMPAGTDAGAGDSAPAQSPTLVGGLTITPGNLLGFTASGSATIGSCCAPTGPDGGSDLILVHDFGAQNGISDVTAPRNSLLGVFLGPGAPDSTPAPAALNFGTAASRDYTNLAPALKQVFFIGDGLTSGAVAQTVTVPAGATRLFLAVMDGQMWNNNTGSFSVNVCDVTPPPPGFNFCLQDESNKKLIFRFNSSTGVYQFTNCVGLELNGVGQVVIKGTDIYLNDNRPDRRVVVKVTQSVKRGNADVQFLPSGPVFTIADRDITSPCACP
jgi:hypothetical protein